MVALNAWLQYRDAKELMEHVNAFRGLTPKKLHRSLAGRLMGYTRTVFDHLGMLCVMLPLFLDKLRMLLFHGSNLRTFEREDQRFLNEELLRRLDKNQLPWTMDTAHYALCGGAILMSDNGTGDTLTEEGFRWLAEHESQSLLPLQRTALQNPSKATGLAKFITCTQALWFCSQCIARLSQNMAISLLELNTFAHCVSALCIYVFWWAKPYDAQMHVHINSIKLQQISLLNDGRCEMSGCVSFLVGNLSRDDKTLPIWLKYNKRTSRLVGHDHQIVAGEVIPGTGFTVSFDESGEKAQSVYASEKALVFWKQLWDIRTSRRGSEPRFDSSDLLPKVHSRVRKNLYSVARASNWNDHIIDSLIRDQGYLVPLVMILVFLAYGGMHLLAWQYHFRTLAESIVWRFAAIATASSGSVILVIDVSVSVLQKMSAGQFADVLMNIVLVTIYSLCFADVLARAFLVVESFRALPNSPASVYEEPRWTAYVPHI